MSFFGLIARTTIPLAEDEGLLQPALSEKNLLPINSRAKSDILGPTKKWSPWLVAWVFAMLWLRLYLRQIDTTLGSYEVGFTSDLFPARSHIQLERKLFRGTAIPEDPAASRDSIVLDLQGPASDEAWNHILKGQYMLLTEDEAWRTWGDDMEQYWDYAVGGYRASVSFTHTLHCLNWLRVMNSTQLQSIEAGEEPQPHHAHCIGQIRQYIICHADLTPLPAFFNRGYPDQDWPHTCRNYDKIREWMWERHNGSLAVAPRFDHKPRK